MAVQSSLFARMKLVDTHALAQKVSKEMAEFVQVSITTVNMTFYFQKSDSIFIKVFK